jgi:hypothetical protein
VALPGDRREITLRAADAAVLASDFLVLRAMAWPSWDRRGVAGATAWSGG